MNASGGGWILTAGGLRSEPGFKWGVVACVGIEGCHGLIYNPSLMRTLYGSRPPERLPPPLLLCFFLTSY